ncbi:MAG: UDP-N-acetylmuramoyl-tripeptide--D-alanyl-D-alanine ligase [Hyphomicrobiaceae bacterium]
MSLRVGWKGGSPSREATITGISIDTRSLEPGDLFVPLTDARDGHEFVPQAFAQGAAAALVRAGYSRQPSDGVLIRVPDESGRDSVLAALERIGMAARARLADTARVIAVTGSAGKTGTKEMLRACLKACASAPEKVHAPEKSFNNHWGVPLTLARMPADTEFAVFEIGMNHAGEIRPLTKMVRPHIAIVTNVLPVHVGNFPDGETGIANAKAEIFEGLESGGTAIILRDSPHYERLRAAAVGAGALERSFGDADSGADVVLRSVGVASENPHDSQVVRAEFAGRGERVTFHLGMQGRHLGMNSLAVLLTLDTLHCNLGRSTRALAEVGAAAGRGARQNIRCGDGELLLLDESYNANPASIAAALASLAAINDTLIRRRIAVLGDMLELGENAVQYHVGLKDSASRADLVFCCGPNMRHLYDALPPEKRGAHAENSEKLIPHVLDALRPGDAVMVKGSLGSRMALVVEALKNHFAN